MSPPRSGVAVSGTTDEAGAWSAGGALGPGDLLLPVRAHVSGIERNNALSAIGLPAISAAIGSALSTLLGMFAVWAVISLALARFPFRLTPSDRAVCFIFTAFALAEFLTAVIAPSHNSLILKTYWLLAFLVPWVLIPRLRASPRVDYLTLYAAGAAIGAGLALIAGLVDVAVLGRRPEAASGNAAVFAIVSMQLGLIAGLNLSSSDGRLRILAWIGLGAGVAAVVLSLTRGVAIVAVPLALLVVFQARRGLGAKTIAALLLASVLAVAALMATEVVSERTERMLQEIEQTFSGETSANIGERLRLWKAGLHAISDAPLLGHGVQNRQDVLVAYVSQDGLPVRPFTHFHNGFLSIGVDGGLPVLGCLLLVLAAPVLISAAAPADDPRRRQRLGIALVLSIGYALTGMSQIMFKHDILDAFFIFTTVVIAISIPAARSERQAG